ncbi:MAG: glycine--tRNA ligase [bacterium]
MKKEPTIERKAEQEKMEKIVSLAKRRGFIFQGSDIYGGLAGTYDYGHLGLALKNNIKQIWWRRFVEDREDTYGVDAAILMNQNVWKASGHVGGFSDPLVECVKCHHRFRADHIVADAKTGAKKCPDCGGDLGAEKQFNMMFKTNVGANTDEASISYLRPETAQGMFVNYKNVLDAYHPKLPFGLVQIGKAFRNEIAPRDFIFRLRELEQMEIEYFVKPAEWKETFEHFRTQVHEFTTEIGLIPAHVHELEVADGDRAHYSKRTIDFEFDFPFGRKELYGLAYRTDFDLRQHSTASGVDLSYFDEETKERYIPHCIEPSFGVERTVLAVLTEAYQEEELSSTDAEGKVTTETRVFLKFSPNVAPIKVAVFPLLKNKPALVDKAREVYLMLKKELAATGVHGVEFDDNGNIGKRYRRQDEIGTPYCVTVDFDTVEKDAGVTVRNRDTGKQERVAICDLLKKITLN